jgi:arylsulfatase A-like enzyme
LIIHNYGGDFAIRRGDWKLVLNGNQTVGENELYNLDKDPKESENLIKAHPEVVQELTNLLKQQKIQGVSNGMFERIQGHWRRDLYQLLPSYLEQYRTKPHQD